MFLQHASEIDPTGERPDRWARGCSGEKEAERRRINPHAVCVLPPRVRAQIPCCDCTEDDDEDAIDTAPKHPIGSHGEAATCLSGKESSQGYAAVDRPGVIRTKRVMAFLRGNE